MSVVTRRVPVTTEMIVREIIRRGARLLEGPGRRFVSLDADDLLAAARRRAGGHEFEDRSFLEGFTRLLQALATEARLNFLGRIASREAIVGHLTNRLQLEEGRRRFPEI